MLGAELWTFSRKICRAKGETLQELSKFFHFFVVPGPLGLIASGPFLFQLRFPLRRAEHFAGDAFGFFRSEKDEYVGHRFRLAAVVTG